MPSSYSPKTISIIGCGRFGLFWARILSEHFVVIVYDTKTIKKLPQGVKQVSYKHVFESDVVIFAVPIRKFAAAVKKSVAHIRPGTTVMDVLSVKTHAQKVCAQYFADARIDVILTHPMFGPDSAAESVAHLPMVMHNMSARKKVFAWWKQFFAKLDLAVVTLSPKQHDTYAAYSQGVTHFVGRVLDNMKLAATPIDTKGFASLLDVKEQTANDTWQLFSDLQAYNPYTKAMRQKLERSLDTVAGKLAVRPTKSTRRVIGVQGGKGSFNDAACQEHCEAVGITDYDIKYLYTSKRVLRALHNGEIDYGQVAMQNAIGGTVRETVHALAQYQCHIVEEFEFLVSHYLMTYPGVDPKQLTAIMSHPQALAQCHQTLQYKYPDLKQMSGTGNLIDNAAVAAALGSGKLDKTIAFMGPEICATYYGLQIIDERLQDMKMNFTTFLWLKQ